MKNAMVRIGKKAYTAGPFCIFWRLIVLALAMRGIDWLMGINPDDATSFDKLMDYGFARMIGHYVAFVIGTIVFLWSFFQYVNRNFPNRRGQ